MPKLPIILLKNQIFVKKQLKFTALTNQNTLFNNKQSIFTHNPKNPFISQGFIKINPTVHYKKTNQHRNYSIQQNKDGVRIDNSNSSHHNEDETARNTMQQAGSISGISSTALIGILATGAATFLVNLMVNNAQQNRAELADIYKECKEAILLNNQLLLDAHVSDCQTRLLFYNEKKNVDIQKHRVSDTALDTQLVKNKLIQNRLNDLIKLARTFGGAYYGRETIERAEELLWEQKRQRYGLLLAKEMNMAIMLHKQGQYVDSLNRIQLIKAMSARKYNPPKQETAYLPVKDNRLIIDSNRVVTYLEKESDFVKNTFINAYNVEGMIIRSLHQQNNNSKYTLADAKQSLETALMLKRHPTVLSNLAFLYNKMANDRESESRICKQYIRPEIEAEIKQLRKQALDLHIEANKNKLNDENDPAIFNGLAYGLTQMGDPNQYNRALGLFERALDAKQNDHDILENKAALLVKIAEEVEKNQNNIFLLSKDTYLEQAKACLDRALNNTAELVDTFELQARISFKLRRFREALDYLDKRKLNKESYADQLHSNIDEKAIELLRSEIKIAMTKQQDKSPPHANKSQEQCLDKKASWLCMRFSALWENVGASTLGEVCEENSKNIKPENIAICFKLTKK